MTLSTRCGAIPLTPKLSDRDEQAAFTKLTMTICPKCNRTYFATHCVWCRDELGYGAAPTREETVPTPARGSAPVPPQRRYTLTLKLGANSIEELCSSLRQIEFTIDVEGSRQSVSGGCGAGWHYDIAENEEMTPERYVEALHEYLAAREPNDQAHPQPGAAVVERKGKIEI